MNPVAFFFAVGIAGHIVGWAIGLGMCLSRPAPPRPRLTPHRPLRTMPAFARLECERLAG